MTTSGVEPTSSAREASEVTRTPERTVPPSPVSSASMARVIASLPPSATGQPTAWAAPPSSSPTEEPSGPVRAPNLCAAMPVISAFAGSSRKRAACQVAGISAFTPNRPSVTGCRGRCATGWKTSSTRSSKSRTIGSKMRRHRAPSTPRLAAESSMSRAASAARPSLSGWARSTSGHSQRRPCRSRSSEARYGEATPVGWKPEHTSWTTPGTVSWSSVRVPPPGRE